MGGKYRRVLIKISGEALSGGKGTGYDIAFVTEVCESVKRCLKMGVQVGIVLAVSDVFRQCGVDARVMTAVEIQSVGERHDVRKALEYLEEGKVVLFACGTGHPFFSTDTAAALRAAEIGADAILLAKNIDGVYSADPKKNPDAVRFDEISYDEVLARRLQVMDSTATSLAMDNGIPVIVFALADPENIVRVLNGEAVGTLVH